MQRFLRISQSFCMFTQILSPYIWVYGYGAQQKMNNFSTTELFGELTVYLITILSQKSSLVKRKCKTFVN